MMYVRSSITTLLGEVTLLADENALYLLEFTNGAQLERKMAHLMRNRPGKIVDGLSVPIRSITSELEQYFAGSLHNFKTPLSLVGTPFQQSVWRELQSIPLGHAKSYAQLACAIQKDAAHRAAANANGENLISIVVPCHRVIRSDGSLGGYAGGIERKKWLLAHEKNLFIAKPKSYIVEAREKAADVD